VGLAALAGCETYEAVEPGARPVSENMLVTATKPWVNVKPPYGVKGADQTWTLDGLGLNRLLIYGGIADGDPLVKIKVKQGVAPPPVFSSAMGGLELQELVSATVSRTMAGGVAVETLELNPVTFMGEPGFEMEFAFPTTGGLDMRGYASGANIDGKLYLVLFVAPRIHYFGKDLDEARAIAASARRA
jgi:hypothetical protein